MTPFSRLASFTSERLAKLASANYMIYSVIYGGRGGGGNQVGLAIHQLSKVSLVMFSSFSPQSKCSWTFLKNSGRGGGSRRLQPPGVRCNFFKTYFSFKLHTSASRVFLSAQTQIQFLHFSQRVLSRVAGAQKLKGP